MQCQKCNQNLPDEAKFCLGCGTPVQLNCSSCQTPLPGGAKFCLSCGQAVAGDDTSSGNMSPGILGYCAGGGSAIRASDPHFKCLRCEKLFTEKFRFHDHPVCESCAYKDGTAQQLEKELSAEREAEARAKEEQLQKKRAEQERLVAEQRALQERQQKEEEERRAKEAAEAKTKPHVCPVTGMEFVIVPAGEFQMGDVWGDGENNEKPTHLVNVAAFQMAKYPVTQAQWLKVMGGENPATEYGSDFVHSNKPIINVSWDDAKEFIKRLNRKSGCHYRLPSEAEWEYAARSGGSRDKYSGTSSESSLSAYAQFKQKHLQEVGKKRPNDLELYDMSGNVWEWCEDTWHDNYQGAPTDGSAWTSGDSGSLRVCRGGSWSFSSEVCRVAYRGRYVQGFRVFNLGFRLSQDSR